MWCGPGPARNSGAGPLARRANPASTTIAIPLTPAASSRSETSFQAVMTMVVPFPAARARCIPCSIIARASLCIATEQLTERSA